MRAAFKALRDNAKRRHKIFTITFQDFKELCIETRYMAGKGREKLSYTLDCKINELGYVKGNIQVLPKIVNCSKGTRSMTLSYDWETKYAKVLHNFRREVAEFDE